MISPWSVVKLHFINTASGYLCKLPSSHAARAFLRRPQEQICLFWSHPRWSDLSALAETMGQKQARLRGPRVTSSLSCLQAWPAHTNRKVVAFYGWQRQKKGLGKVCVFTAWRKKQKAEYLVFFQPSGHGRRFHRWPFCRILFTLITTPSTLTPSAQTH